MTPRTITGAHRIYVLPKERNKSESVDYCAQSTTLVEALTKDSLVEHLIIKCSDPWGFVFPEQLVSQTEREKPLRITLLLTEHIDHVRGNLPRWEEFVARARTEGMLKGQVYKSGWQDCVVPRGVYVPSGLMTRIACRDKDASNFPDPTKGGKQEDNFTYRFITDASLAKGSTAEELAQIRAYFGVDLSHSFKPIRKIKNGIVTDTQADMWVYEFLYARQMIEAHGASSGVYMNMLYWLNASEANITDFWEVAEATEDTARELEGKLDKPKNGSYVLDAEISNKIKEKITNDTKLQELIKGEKGEKGDQGAKGDKGDTPKLTLDEQFRLYADGNLVSSQTLKGDRGEEGPRGTTGAKGDKGDKGDTGASGTNVGRNLLLNSGAPRFQDGRYTEYKLAYPIDKEGAYFLSFDVAFFDIQNYVPYDHHIQVIFGYQTSLQTIGYIDAYESDARGYSRLRLNVTKNSTYKGSAESIYIYPNGEDAPPDTDPFCGKFTIKNVMLEYGTKPTVWSPAPEDFLVQLDEAKTTLTTDIGRARSRADDAYGLADNVNRAARKLRTDVKLLQHNSLTENEKEWVGKMGQVLKPDSEESSGLTVDRSVFLRFSDGKPSALIGGQIGKGAVLMAGVQDYGTTNQSARTEIYQDGTAKFGDVNLSDKTIELMPKSGLPLRVTAEEGTFIENFLANSKDDRNIAYEKSFVVVGKGEVQTYSFDVANNDTKLTITIPKLTSEVYQINQSVILTLDGVTLGSWHGDTKLIKEDYSGFEGGGVRFRKENTPLVVENLKFERYLSSGSHTLSVSVTSTDTRDKATITKLTAHLYYDASQAETILTHKGFRAFGGQNRYFDIDWRWTYRAKGYFTTSNPYIARVKGGMRLDSLTLEQPLDAPGCVLAGGRVENSYVRASFGKYKNKRGDSKPVARFDNDDKIYSVFHSIGNTNYTPIVTSCAGQWGDVPQVIGVYEYRFDVRFINYNNEFSVDWNFNYVCYKGD